MHGTYKYDHYNSNKYSHVFTEFILTNTLLNFSVVIAKYNGLDSRCYDE